jgi:hypothetical protein
MVAFEVSNAVGNVPPPSFALGYRTGTLANARTVSICARSRTEGGVFSVLLLLVADGTSSDELLCNLSDPTPGASRAHGGSSAQHGG